MHTFSFVNKGGNFKPSDLTKGTFYLVNDIGVIGKRKIE